jgi:hypothetical protein
LVLPTQKSTEEHKPSFYCNLRGCDEEFGDEAMMTKRACIAAKDMGSVKWYAGERKTGLQANILKR